MAELLSIQVHAPTMTSSALATAVPGPAFVVGGVPAAAATAGGGGRLTRLKKVDNRTLEGGALSQAAFGHVPERQPIDVEFNGLTYSVSEGRKKGELVS